MAPQRTCTSLRGSPQRSGPKLNLLQLVLMALLMYPLTMRYGIMGAAVAAMLPSVLVVVLTLHEAGKIIGENFTYIAR
ncbi:MAG: hypothetical protein Q8M95_13765, partial [Candidatus Methanoperedens sp.]|nr:hypothetical protein [Candidatus Methanoperedens sp.]